MAKLVDRMKKTLKEGLKAVKKGAQVVAEKTPEVASAVAEKTQEAVQTGKVKLQIQNLNRDMDRVYGEIGKKVHALVKKKAQRVESDEAVKKNVRKIDELKKRIRQLEASIKEQKQTG